MNNTSNQPEHENLTAPKKTLRASARLVALFAIAAGVLGLDQLTKWIAESTLSLHEPVDVIGSFLRFTLIYNSGAAFSIGTGITWVLTIVATAVVVTIIVIARRLGSWLWAVALGVLLGGALGNLTDRLFRPPGFGQGHVVDFIQLPNFAIFNVADMAITCAAVLIVLLAFRGIGLDGRRLDPEKPSSDSAPDLTANTAGPHGTDLVGDDPDSSADSLPSDGSAPVTNPAAGNLPASKTGGEATPDTTEGGAHG